MTTEFRRPRQDPKPQPTAHTPGPWVLAFARNGYPYQIDAPHGSRGPGGITSVTRWGAISFPSSREGLANARLMAAAPELLAALQNMVGANDSAVRAMMECETDVAMFAIAKKRGEAFGALIEPAREAIAKALGAVPSAQSHEHKTFPSPPPTPGLADDG